MKSAHLILRSRPSFRLRGPRPLWGNEHTVGSVTHLPKNTITIDLPARLDFEENYESTVSHFKTLRDAVRTERRIKKLRFDNIEFISPSAALVLASEVDQWSWHTPGKLKAEVDHWNEDIKRLLCEMGFFELLGIPRPLLPKKESRVTFLRFLRREAGDPNPGKIAQQLRANIEAIIGPKLNRNALYEGLSEAITNVGHHAYPNQGIYGRRGQWWMSASFDNRGQNLTVMFYDQGVGIPTTLPNSRFFERLKNVMHLWPDSRRIEAAMSYGRSSTELPQRGKGLENFVEFAKTYPDGKLSIYSSCGLFQMMRDNEGKMNTMRKDHDESIGGTLIEWSVRLAGNYEDY